MLQFFAENKIISTILSSKILTHLLRILVYIIIGILIIRLIRFLVGRLIAGKSELKSKILIDKFITYSGISVIIVAILSEMGVNLTAILGAAGIMGLALGVASQKSLGNIISGLFLLSEKTYEIGDAIKIGDKTGIVYSIDLLSLKIRTFDNLLIRLPNELLISSTVTNITRFPIRRMDFDISVSYKDDLDLVHKTLLSIAKENPLCMNEPEPFFLLKNFSTSGIELVFGIWFEKSEYILTRNTIVSEIKTKFAEAGITIPFTQITVHNGDLPMSKNKKRGHPQK